MKNIILLCLFSIISLQSFAQWTHKTVNSEFDGTFKKAYTETSNFGYLLMEQDEGFEELYYPAIALRGTYFCDDYTTIDLVFTVNSELKRYEIYAVKSDDSKFYFFNDFVWTEEFISDFKSATKCSIRVNQKYCSDEYYSFNMKGSKAAYEFMTKE